jgi:hypothetical protein
LERGLQHGAERHHGLETQTREAQLRRTAHAGSGRRTSAGSSDIICDATALAFKESLCAAKTSARKHASRLLRGRRVTTHPSRLCRLWSSSSASGRLGGSSRARFAWPVNMSPSACAAAPAGVLRAGSEAYHGTFEAGATVATAGRGDGAGGTCIEICVSTQGAV